MFKSKKRIRELEHELAEKDAFIEILKKKNEEFAEYINGNLIKGAHCVACENYYQDDWSNACLFNVPCGKFKRKNAENCS